jgi:hypothetical protein
MRIGRGNQNNQRKPTSVPFCPPQIPTWTDRGRNSDRRGETWATNRLRHINEANYLVLLLRCLRLTKHNKLLALFLSPYSGVLLLDMKATIKRIMASAGYLRVFYIRCTIKTWKSFIQIAFRFTGLTELHIFMYVRYYAIL